MEENDKICWAFKKSGRCQFGDGCKYSHDLRSSTLGQARADSEQDGNKTEITLESQRAQAELEFWNRLIKKPPKANDVVGMREVWSRALEILDGDYRDGKQYVPKNLDDDETYCGREHIRALLGMRPYRSQYYDFIEASRQFLQVITHSTFVDCLSVDTQVKDLYTFISGANGSRAISFFKNVAHIIGLVRAGTVARFQVGKLNTTLVALSASLCELLRRQNRARLNDSLLDLIACLDTAAERAKVESPVTFSILSSRVEYLLALVSHAKASLSEENDAESEELPSIIRSIYPRDIVMPGSRHDNDKADITDISIFPTREEIMSDAAEFLPSTDPGQPHFLISKVKRHIDTYFRLLRHDVFGELKFALGGLMHAIVEDPGELTNVCADFWDTRIFTYHNAWIDGLTFNRRGLMAQMSILQPYCLGDVPVEKRQSWWKDSKRLGDSGLLSFIWMQNSTLQHLFLTVVEKSQLAEVEEWSSQDDSLVTVTVKLTMQNQSAVSQLLDLSRQKSRGVLLESPHIIPATFVPVLENLQSMQRLGRLPFADWILLDRIDGRAGAKLSIPPPLYARDAEFSYSMTSIALSGGEIKPLHPSRLSDDPALMASFVADLEANTELDQGQCVALVTALCREFAFIQGPPGTGKTFLGVKLMKVLLEAKEKADLGPIVVVCYTNHALDQFLEHLLDMDISKIIRVGSQSRSNLLELHNLHHVRKKEARRAHENRQNYMASKKLKECEGKSPQILERLHGAHNRPEWETFEPHLSFKYARICDQFFKLDRTNEDGSTSVGPHAFDKWANDGTSSHTSVTQPGAASTAPNVHSIVQKAEKSVQSLSREERHLLIQHWTQEMQVDAEKEFFKIIKDAQAAQCDLKNVYDEVSCRVLQEADVIGITTTGLAKNMSALQQLCAKVVICEEAGEVMEPHILSALLPTVEHFIQIGDHQQLRPSINNFQDLSLESTRGAMYQLDRSQFERLSVGMLGRPSMPIAQLNHQRRMRPEISTLIRETVYDKLVDHSTTQHLPNVVGLRKNVFWLHHDNMEDAKQEALHHKSKSNSWEVGMVHALVRHLVRQGVYEKRDIAVLTPYTGQLQKLRTALRNDFEMMVSEHDEEALTKERLGAEDVSDLDRSTQQPDKGRQFQKKKLSDLLRIGTVDNFQGEEAKVVIISLVRSNENRNVGFLKTPNRINVLLSRAQHGMYLIGNAETYTNVPMWQKVIEILRSKDSFGRSLDLCCPRHLGAAIKVQQPDDFGKFSPEGGCQEICNNALPDCGHPCQAKCHSQAMHDVAFCEQPCLRRHQRCNHLCQKPTCGQNCGDCMVRINNVQLPCGHSNDNVPCYLTQDGSAVECNHDALKRVHKCGHIIQVQCRVDVNQDTFQCPALCEKEVPGCGHIVQTQCHVDVKEATFHCPAQREVTLPCGHQWLGPCSRCGVSEVDGQPAVKYFKCISACGRRHATCNHACTRRCHGWSDCGACTFNCDQNNMQALSVDEEML